MTFLDDPLGIFDITIFYLFIYFIILVFHLIKHML